MSEDDFSDRDGASGGGPFRLADVIGPALETIRERVPANDNSEKDEVTALGLLQAALELTELGAVVFPVVPRQKAPALLKSWQQITVAHAPTVLQWWTRHQRANIALLCGARSGVVVVDIDGAEGESTLAELEREHGALPVTVTVLTGRGRHLYFAHPGRDVPNSASRVGPKIDVKADGGYVLTPPSLHPSGAVYRWAPGRRLGALELAPMPEWLLALALKREHEQPPSNGSARAVSPDEWAQKNKYWLGAVAGEVQNILAAADGKLNNTINLAAYKLGGLVAGEGFEPAYASSELLRAAVSKGHPERGARASIESGLTSGMDAPLHVPAPQAAQYGGKNGSAGAGAGAPRASNTNGGEKPEDAEPVRPAGGIIRLGVNEIFAPLPPSRWAVHELQIGPGRPGMFAGYGASAKTLAAQQFALAKASGAPIWGRFACEPGVVLHLDYEQGKHASIKRYQRLARGHGIAAEQLGQRLYLGVLPRVYLDDRNAADSFKAAFEGVDLAIIDALRGAAPESDENDSSIRRTLDLLTYVSEYTGTTCIVLHHAGKPKGDGKGESDKRTLTRGSSAIFDACGCVLIFEAGKSGEGPKHISQQKQPAEAEGGKIKPFDLVVEDIECNGNPSAGVRVNWTAPAPTDPAAKAQAAFDRDAERLIAVVRADSGIAANSLIERSGMGRTRAFKMLAALVDEARLAVFEGGDGKTRRYRVTDVR